MSQVVITLLPPECHVCGQKMESQFLRPFPGAPDIKACPICIATYTQERQSKSKGRGTHDQNNQTRSRKYQTRKGR